MTAARPDPPETARPPLSLVGEVTAPAFAQPSPAQPSPAAAPSAPPPPVASSPSEPVKRAYPAPAEVPTQEGPKGARFDFNDGARVLLPESDRPWKIRLSDLDTGNILFQ